MFVLKADSTFDYTERTNAGTVTMAKQVDDGIVTTTTYSYIFTDSGYGTYLVLNDRLYLTYATEEVKETSMAIKFDRKNCTGKESRYIIYIQILERYFDRKNTT
jgi:hypothetical protein